MRARNYAPARLLEAAFVVMSVIVLTDAIDLPLDLMLRGYPALLGIPIKRLFLVPILLGSALILRRSWPAVRAVSRDLTPVVALIGLAAVSALWSPIPTVTLTWTAGLAATTLFGMVLALRFTKEEQQQLLGAALAPVVAGSLLSVFAPDAYHAFFGRRGSSLIGLFYDSNLFGRTVALWALTCTVLAVGSPRSRPAALAGALVALLVLHGTHSLTSEIALLAGLATAGVLWVGQRLARRARRRLLVAGAVTYVIVAGAVAAEPVRLLKAMGKSVTLNGRLDIWEDVARGIGDRPWLGSGYAGYWHGAVADPRVGLHAHNGFLDLTAELGVVGLLLFAVPAVVYARRAVIAALAGRSGLALWPPAYLAFLAVMNLAESDLVRHKLAWALYVAALLWTAGRSAPQAGETLAARPKGEGLPRSRVDIVAKAAELDVVDDGELMGARVGGQLFARPLAERRVDDDGGVSVGGAAIADRQHL